MKKIIVSILIVFVLFLSSCGYSTVGGGDVPYHYTNQSQYSVDIMIRNPRRRNPIIADIRSLAPGDTAKIYFHTVGLGSNVHNPFLPDDWEGGDGVPFETGLENLEARITFITPEGNRCLVFEGAEPTTGQFPDIRLWSGYGYMGGWDVIYTIADSLFAEATVCE